MAAEAHVHVVDHLFLCWLVDGEGSAGGSLEVDLNQFGGEGLPLAELERCRFYPRALIPALREALSRTDAVPTVYVGDIN